MCVGHKVKITALGLLGRDIVSGDITGLLNIWDSATGTALHQIQAHDGAITCLQFDAVKLVTTGADRSVQVYDIVSGARLSSMPAAHEDTIVALQYDPSRMLTVSRDGIMRYWNWDAGTQEEFNRKTHIVRKRDLVGKLIRQYDISVADLLRWNELKDPRDIYPGQTIFVGPDRDEAAERSEAKADETAETDK